MAIVRAYQYIKTSDGLIQQLLDSTKQPTLHIPVERLSAKENPDVLLQITIQL